MISLQVYLQNSSGKGNDLVVFGEDRTTKLGLFQFPRQKSGNRYCISDYFNDLDKNFFPIEEKQNISKLDKLQYTC